MKSIPLYVGGLFIAAAIAGAVMSLVTPAPQQAAPPPIVAPHRAPEPDMDEISPEQVKAQDEEDIIKILLAQIEQTPSKIDEAWLADMCQQISDADSLDAFWKAVVASGESYGAGYTRKVKSGTVMSRNPLYYVFEAREFIYSTDPQEKKLLGSSRGLLDMAIAKSWEASRKEIQERLAKEQRMKLEDIDVPAEMGHLDDEVRTTYFKEYLRLYSVLIELADKHGEDSRQYVDKQIRLHEAAVVDRHLRMMETMSDARERYSGNTNSAKPAIVQITRWSNAVNERLLSLGKVYIDAALAEKVYRGRMEDYADLGFKALAMVYQRSQSGEALRAMREVNRIQRYNLWQMARVAWKEAKAMAAAGRIAEADDGFLLAKHNYLKCLSRLESSKKPVVFGEYRRLQADITEWVTSRKLKSVAAATDG